MSVPVCDAACQKKRKLDGLKATLDSKSSVTDPAGYQQAKIAYYTELYGDTWLEGEKERISKDEIEPTTTWYTSKYNNLKQETNNQGNFINTINLLKENETVSEEELRFLTKKAQEEADKIGVVNRLYELNSGEQVQEQPSSLLTLILNIVLAIAGIYLGYKILRRIFVPNQQSMLTNTGKTVLNRLII